MIFQLLKVNKIASECKFKIFLDQMTQIVIAFLNICETQGRFKIIICKTQGRIKNRTGLSNLVWRDSTFTVDIVSPRRDKMSHIKDNLLLLSEVIV